MTIKLLLLAVVASAIVACIDYKIMKQQDIVMSTVMALGIWIAMFLLLFV